MRPYFLLLLTLMSSMAAAEPIAALRPMAFLAGSCWTGLFADGKSSDEHCFQWLYDGFELRDTHRVRAPGKPDYVGETTYYWDAAAKKIEFLYFENSGGISRGSMESAPPALLFPPAVYVGDDGETLTYRARWTPIGTDSYEVQNEILVKDAWVTQFKLVLNRKAP